MDKSLTCERLSFEYRSPYRHVGERAGINGKRSSARMVKSARFPEVSRTVFLVRVCGVSIEPMMRRSVPVT